MTPRRRIIPLFIPHLGCPNHCVFCNQKRISGSRFPVTAETVRARLRELPAGAGYELAFYGGSFTAIAQERQEELLESVQPFRESGAISAVRLSTRPDAVDAGTLDRLSRYGVTTVELGAQSMSDEVLRASLRGHTARDTERAAALVKRAGFTLILQMMTGLPLDTDESAVQSARLLAALRPDGVRIYPTVIVRGTALEALWEKGLYREHTVEDAVRVCARILPLFEEARIPVIRIGLNPTDELSGGEAMAGAYHPALGELVRSRVLLERARALLQGVPAGSEVILGVGKGLRSAMTGQHRGNLIRLRSEFCLKSVRVCELEDAQDKLHLRIANAPEV